MQAKLGCNCRVGAVCPHLGRRKEKNDLREYLLSNMIKVENPGYMMARTGCNCRVGAMCPHLDRKKKKNDLREYLLSNMIKEFQKTTVKAKATAKAKGKAKTAKAKAKEGKERRADWYCPKLATKQMMYDNVVLLQHKLDSLQASHDLLQTDHDNLRQFVEFHIDAGE